MSLQKNQHNKLTTKILAYSTLIFSCAAQADTDLNIPQITPVSESAYEIKATNSLWEDKRIDPGFYDVPYQISLFNPANGEDSKRVLSQTYTVIGAAFATLAVLAAMPNSVINWKDGDEPDLSQKWLDNVSDGPVWDRDHWPINYLGHPYFGGVYYQVARKSGYRQWDAFIYSFMMSTFCWEYGIEAFAEEPSIQDLVVTPVLGWVYGEWAFNTERDIWLNDGHVLGSETLGNISLFLLDPIDSIGRNINYLFGRDIIKAGTGYFTFGQTALADGNGTEKQIGLKVSYKLGKDDNNAAAGSSGKIRKYSSYKSHSVDPVDTGIVGLSAGGIWVDLDNKWGLNNAYGRQFSLGLYFTRNFSTRLSYSRAESEARQNNDKLVYENYGLDMQYYLNSQSDWRPFLSAGVGEIMFEKKQTYLQINGGLGLHYKINNNWAVQSDYRHYYSFRTNTNENQLGTAIIYRFGKGEWSL